MSKNIFVDANILIDIMGISRPFHKESLKTMHWLIKEGCKLFTSCDIMTTVYYINTRENKKQALQNIMYINTLCHVIEFSNDEITQTCELMLKDRDYTDLEDTIQYILALKEDCELILTNDKNFVSKEIPTISSEKFLRKFKI